MTQIVLSFVHTGIYRRWNELEREILWNMGGIGGRRGRYDQNELYLRMKKIKMKAFEEMV